MAVVLGLVGAFKSGKTTLGSELATRLGWPKASFGELVRAEARSRSLDDSRETLQDLREKLISELGWRKFVGSVLASGGTEGNLIVEGFRHLEAVDTAKLLVAPRTFVCVGISVGQQARSDRDSTTRQTVSDEVVAKHSTEREVPDVLRSRTDFIVPSRDVANMADEVVGYLRSRALIP